MRSWAKGRYTYGSLNPFLSFAISPSALTTLTLIIPAGSSPSKGFRGPLTDLTIAFPSNSPSGLDDRFRLVILFKGLSELIDEEGSSEFPPWLETEAEPPAPMPAAATLEGVGVAVPERKGRRADDAILMGFRASRVMRRGWGAEAGSDMVSSASLGVVDEGIFERMSGMTSD